MRAITGMVIALMAATFLHEPLSEANAQQPLVFEVASVRVNRSHSGTTRRIDNVEPLFTALQEQLGLELKSEKAPVDILVVDYAEKVPTEN
jgi:Protein of unknown function (DUF3738)